MIARVWHGVVPVEKAEGYGRYLADSELGVRAYRAIRGNRGVSLLRRSAGDRVQSAFSRGAMCRNPAGKSLPVRYPASRCSRHDSTFPLRIRKPTVGRRWPIG